MEILAGATRVPVTAKAYTRDPIQIQRGRQDAGAELGPGSCNITLNNLDGTWSPRNPRSPYYGVIGQNTPVRVWARGPRRYLWLPGAPGDRARVASDNALNVAGDLDVRVDVALDRLPTLSSILAPQVNELIGRYNINSNARMWRLLLTNDGRPSLTWSTDGANAIERIGTAVVPHFSGQRFALRATLDTDNGASGHSVTFYTARTMAGPWEQLGDAVVTAGTTSVNTAGTADLEVGEISTIGFSPGGGRYYAAEVRDGIGGPAVANPDFTAQPEGTGSFTDSAGRSWTIQGGGTITALYCRFVGEAAKWPDRWAPSGKDVWVELEVAGMLRRYGQRNKALESTLRRFIPGHSGLLAYWPMEDGAEATRAVSALADGRPMLARDLAFAANDSLVSSDALPALGDAASINAPLPALPSGSTGWRVEMVYRLDAIPTGSQKTMISVATSGGGIAQIVGSYSTAGLQVAAYDGDGVLLGSFNTTDAGILALGAQGWSRLILRARPGTNPGDTDYWLIVAPIGQNTQQGVFYTRSGFTRPRRIATSYGSGLASMPIGHITYTASPDTSVLGGGEGAADSAYRGETAVARLRRLAQEEQLLLIATGLSSNSEPMGPQRIATALDVIQDCEDVDGGVLAEQRETLGLQYRARRMRYNQRPRLTLDYTAPGHLAPPLEPDSDDLTIRNQVTVSVPEGSSSPPVALEEGPLSVQPPPAGAGVYDEAVTLNLASDEQAEPQAWWRVHLGTWDEARYPSVTIKLHTAPDTVVEDVLNLDSGDIIEITNLPDWLPPGPVRLIVEGYTETILPRTWEITFACSPAGPWTVGVVGDPVLGRVDTAGSVLAAAVGAADTTLLVNASGDLPWATDAEVPFDVTLAGEDVTVTAVAPGAPTADRALTVTRSVNGITKPHALGTSVALKQPAVVAL
ncbi:hypothetical protein DMB38_12730 [Streptomyces sp. WAC 06738]|nr:hypothetical protein DMB38_12730 [Streptomyces sp. WAC 06738]